MNMAALRLEVEPCPVERLLEQGLRVGKRCMLSA
jgi:hypothetical protein